jgi:methylenetetrahydrofolate dehydrogenase (NADP+)/methenyltetrahydrofolate cyclohydrolase
MVGLPLATLMLKRNSSVTILHSYSHSLREHVQSADLLISATGVREIPAEWVKLNAVVIDVGIRWQAGRIMGDVEFEKVKEKVRLITPVPGGVGPLTVVMLVKNLVN